MRRLEDALAVGMQAVLVEFRIVPYRLPQRGEAVPALHDVQRDAGEMNAEAVGR